MLFVVVDALLFGVSCLSVFVFCRVLCAVSCFCFVACFFFCVWCRCVQLIVSSLGFDVGYVIVDACFCLFICCLLFVVGCLV